MAVTTAIPFSAAAADRVVPAVALDPGFDARWAAWVARGTVHERRGRRRFVVRAGVLATAAAIVYALIR